jgi:hypothetical protein
MQIYQFFKELGYASTFSSNVILAVLEQLQIYPQNAFKKISESDISLLLGMMAQTHSGLPENPTLKSLTVGIVSEEEEKAIFRMKTWNVELFFPMLFKMVDFI